MAQNATLCEMTPEPVTASSSMVRGATQAGMTPVLLPTSARAGPQSSTPGSNARTVVRAERGMNPAVSLAAGMTPVLLPTSARAGLWSSTPGSNARTVVRAERGMNPAVSLAAVATKRSPPSTEETATASTRGGASLTLAVTRSVSLGGGGGHYQQDQDLGLSLPGSVRLLAFHTACFFGGRGIQGSEPACQVLTRNCAPAAFGSKPDDHLVYLS
jgi:hypothetical protein